MKFDIDNAVGSVAVLKLNGVAHEPVPLVLVALTLQKYFVLPDSLPAGTVTEDAVIPDVSNVVEPKMESTET